MNSCRKLSAVCCLLVGLGGSPVWAVSYVATLLHPAPFEENYSSSGADASGTRQVGSFDGYPAIWNGTAESYIPLESSTNYAVLAIDDVTQVGLNLANQHAVKWNGTPQSRVDLHPAGFTSSTASDVSGATQVGYGNISSQAHALLWTGTAASVVDMHPGDPYKSSAANGVWGASQVGQGILNSSIFNHALLWNGTAASVVDLNPVGATSSIAHAVYGTHQVGQADLVGGRRAFMWNGSAESYVNLHPAGFTQSEARDISAAGQVGHATIGSPTFARRALYWNGTAGSVVNLHESLTELIPQLTESEALGISDNGTIVGTAYSEAGTYAVLWVPAAGVPGDYDDNGAVDGADYVLWRSGTSTLKNEVATSGTSTPEDYTEWRARFGNPSGNAAGDVGRMTFVPEPASLALFAGGLSIVAGRRLRRK